MAKTVKIGMVGVGDISGIYLQNITGCFKEIELVAVCDLVREKAERAQEKYNIPKLYDTMYELFADPEIDIVLNLTRPYEHYGVSIEAVAESLKEAIKYKVENFTGMIVDTVNVNVAGLKL